MANEKTAKEDGLTAAEAATKSLEEAKGKPQKSQKEAEDKARAELVPVTELGLAPSKSTGQLVPDTQTGVMAAQVVDPKAGEATGKVTVKLEGAAAPDGEEKEIELDFFDGGDLAGTFAALKSQLDAVADEKSRKMASVSGRALRETTGVTQDNFENTPEAKGREGERFATDAEKFAAELKAQNEAREKAPKKADKK